MAENDLCLKLGPRQASRRSRRARLCSKKGRGGTRFLRQSCLRLWVIAGGLLMRFRLDAGSRSQPAAGPHQASVPRSRVFRARSSRAGERVKEMGACRAGSGTVVGESAYSCQRGKRKQKRKGRAPPRARRLNSNKFRCLVRWVTSLIWLHRLYQFSLLFPPSLFEEADAFWTRLESAFFKNFVGISHILNFPHRRLHSISGMFLLIFPISSRAQMRIVSKLSIYSAQIHNIMLVLYSLSSIFQI